MNTEHLIVRAKTLEGKWIEGYYADELYFEGESYQNCILNKNIGFAEIDPETIGRFTGLHDSDGKKIWEGDILDENGYFFSVVWDQERAKFKLQHNKRAIQYPEWNRGIMMKVVGNIHDNPEMIEGGKP
jgi:hypothetical protein